MKSNPFYRITAVSVIHLAMASVPLVATAADAFGDQVTTVRKAVSMDSYDLSTRQGAEQARQRIRRETHRLCRELGNSSRIDDRESQFNCFSKAYENALQQLEMRIAASSTARIASTALAPRAEPGANP